MSEKIEFDFVVKNNELEKTLTKAAKSTDNLAENVKRAYSILSKNPVSSAVQESIENLGVNSIQFKNEI